MRMVDLDIHTHSISSGHGTRDTVTDMIREAAERGLKTLGITEHGPATPGAPKPSYFRSLSAAPRRRFGINVLYGAEVNILEGGETDLGDDILSGLDLVIASMHAPPRKNKGTARQNTDDYLKAMKNRYVRILGHCDNTQFPVFYDEIVRGAAEYSVIVEINESSLIQGGYHQISGIDTKENYMTLLSLCRQFRVPVLLSSDSHGHERIGSVSEAEKLTAKSGFPGSLIVNRNPELLLT